MTLKPLTVEEYWPGQKHGLRTARIEVWLKGEHWTTEVGRITADAEIFDQVREAVEYSPRHARAEMVVELFSDDEEHTPWPIEMAEPPIRMTYEEFDAKQEEAREKGKREAYAEVRNVVALVLHSIDVSPNSRSARMLENALEYLKSKEQHGQKSR